MSAFGLRRLVVHALAAPGLAIEAHVYQDDERDGERIEYSADVKDGFVWVKRWTGPIPGATYTVTAHERAAMQQEIERARVIHTPRWVYVEAFKAELVTRIVTEDVK